MPICYGSLAVTGARLGGPTDTHLRRLLRDGRLAAVRVAGTAAQTAMTVTVPATDALPAGAYRIMVRVNGEQALDAPEAVWA